MHCAQITGVSMEAYILNANPDEFPLYSLEGTKTLGKFCTNYDGDTCHMLLMIDGNTMFE